MDICIVYMVLNNIKVNGGRKVTCAIHVAHWVHLGDIVSTSFFWQQVRLVDHLGNFGEKRIKYYNDFEEE